jgi:probable rRNA maturation factor
MSFIVDVQYAQERLPTVEGELPAPGDFQRWVDAALSGRREAGEMTIRVVDEAEGAKLNKTYRHRSGPTNVLSFPAEGSPHLDLPLLGDLVICAPLVVREAREQCIAAIDHWAHLTVHGTLHLLGYDHETAGDAEIMEGLEAKILVALGYADPYAGEKATLTAC